MKDAILRLKEKGRFIDDNDVKLTVTAFIEEYPDRINLFCKKAYGDINSVSLASFKLLLQEELKNAIIAFVNGKYSYDNLRAYLLVSVQTAATRLSSENKKNVNICPACYYLGQVKNLQSRGKHFVCFACSEAVNSEQNSEAVALHKVFAEHSSRGHRCPDCNEFIPRPLDSRTVVSCPFPNCFYSGRISELSGMQHPRMRSNIEIAILDGSLTDNSSRSIKDLISENNQSDISRFDHSGGNSSSSTDNDLCVRQAVNENLKVLMEVIESQQNSLKFNSNESTFKHKSLMYDAYINIIKQYPQEMIGYLVHQNRNGGLQHKIFQEYANLLEAALPYSYLKGGKPIVITSLLDKNLCVFDGCSEFEAEVLESSEIDNKTKEFYIGGRKGFYCKPFYIGKLLEITDINTGLSLLGKVKEYSFFKIEIDKSVPIGTKVQVKHLRIPPHYQMGGMVYLNRIRRKIVDKVYKNIHGCERELSR